MIGSYWAGYWDYWELNHKVTFDGENSIIYINSDASDINVARDLYSASKEWLSTYDYAKYLPPLRSIGGDPTVGGDFAGAIFFLTNGWKVILTHTVSFFGSIFSDDYDSPFETSENIYLAFSQVANLVDKVAVPSAIDWTEEEKNLILESLWSEEDKSTVLTSTWTEEQKTAILNSLWTSQDKDELTYNVEFIRKIEEGRWKIVNNQMIFYDSDGVTPLRTFNLFDKEGAPTETEPFERNPV